MMPPTEEQWAQIREAQRAMQAFAEREQALQREVITGLFSWPQFCNCRRQYEWDGVAPQADCAMHGSLPNMMIFLDAGGYRASLARLSGRSDPVGGSHVPDSNSA